jgi:uncharacterized protein
MPAYAVARHRDRVLIPRVELATGFWQRAIGLMGRRDLSPDQALFLKPCRSIHTCFMRFTLDAIFLDAENRVVRVVRGLRPWRAADGGRRAVGVLEFPAGRIPEDAIEVGATLTITCLP